MKRLTIVLILTLAAISYGQQVTSSHSFVQAQSPFAETEALEAEGKFIFGHMFVPERAEFPEGQKIKIAIGIFKSRNAQSLDPLVLCAGGPGLSNLDDFVPGLVGELGDLFLENRDVVIIDYRGLKYADPYLEIPEMQTLQLSLLDKNLGVNETIDLYLKVLDKAYREFSSRGYDLSAVNSQEIANEIVYAMTQLGYQRFSMFGSSYGSEIVQNILLYHPGRISSAVLNGSVDIYRSGHDMHRGMVEALEETFQAVNAEPELKKVYPDLKERFLNKVSELNAKPDTLSLFYQPKDREYQVVLNGNRVALWLFFQMYFNTQLPRSLDKICSGDYSEIVSNPGLIFPIPEFSLGLSLSVFMSGTYDISPEDKMAGSEYEELIQGASLSTFGPYFYEKAIKAWPVKPRKAPGQFTTEIPLLLLGGKMDHLCKPSYAVQLAQNNENAHLFLFEDVVHSPVDRGPCAILMLKEFLDEPSRAPDSSCMGSYHHAYLPPD